MDLWPVCFTLSVSINVDQSIVHGWVLLCRDPRGFPPGPLCDFFPRGHVNLWEPCLNARTHIHEHACIHCLPRGASQQVTGQGRLIQSWSQTSLQDFPGLRPVPGIPFQAGAEAGLASPALHSPCRKPGLSQLEQGLGARQKPAPQQFVKQE